MNNEKMAQFIYELRKSKNLTQQQLAEKLNITNKTISKWERGLGCPDISLLPALSDILGVTTRELLNGEKAEASAPEIETIVESTLQYADTITKGKTRNHRLVAALILSAISFIAIIICIICNYAIEGALSWALFPISSIIFTLLVIIPIILWGKKGITISLIMFSILIILFLFVLERIIGIKGLIMPIGSRISIISIIYLWIVFFLFTKSKLYKYVSFAATLIIAIPITWWINIVSAKYTGQPAVDIWDVMTYSILAVLGIITFVIGYIKEKGIIK